MGLVWLTEEERELAVTRLPQTEHVQMTWNTLRTSILRVVTTWRWYLFVALFTVSATAFEKVGVYTEFNLWLKSTGTYTPQQINYYPSIFTAVCAEPPALPMYTDPYRLPSSPPTSSLSSVTPRTTVSS
jgi:hypothetical protein